MENQEPLYDYISHFEENQYTCDNFQDRYMENQEPC